jgi:glycosyltransferase involved in cell wall biosynthesis
MAKVHWVYLDLPQPLRAMKRLPGGIYLYYLLWQVQAWLIGQRLHRRIRFDLAHHVTFVTYWMPSLLALLPIPFVWGPVGGGESAPAVFRQTFAARGRAYEILRTVARRLGELNPLVIITARRAQLALATTAETRQRLLRLKCRRIVLCSQVALPHEELKLLAGASQTANAPFTVISVGRLLHWKGFQLGIAAFADFTREFAESEYWIIGSGPEHARLQRSAKRFGVGDKVRFLGALPRGEVLARLARAQVLLHPSLHDSGAGVCVEAMAAGLPVICLDVGGPGLQISDDAGFRVPACTPDQVKTDIASALRQLARERDVLLRLSRGARHRANEMTWMKKGEAMKQFYRQLVPSPRSV